MGRNTFSVKFDDDVAESLVRYCNAMGYNKTDVIRTAVASHLGDVISSNVKLLQVIEKDGTTDKRIRDMLNTLMGGE